MGRMKTPGLDELLDLVIIGVGPPALVALHAAQEAGLSAIGIDKGPVCGALVNHPIYMRWFSTSDKLELCGFPLLINEKNPTRREYLKYCRAFTAHYDLRVVTYREVTQVTKQDNVFRVVARDIFGREYTWRTKNVVAGTGFYESPRPLNDVEGADLPKVSHRYTEAHMFSDHDVLIVGGGSSAAEIALELWREHTRVTVLLRGTTFHTKFWVEPDIENRIKEGSIRCFRNAELKAIRPDDVVVVDCDGNDVVVENDFVLAMTGYEPDTSLIESLGAKVDHESKKPVLTEHLETTVPGLYVMGTLIAGVESNVVFIENSREHGPTIVQHIRQ